MVKPFIRWAGGKQNLVQDLLKNVPDDNLIGRYYEPFLGAGSLFFANGFKNAFISDINFQLINAYKEIRNDYQSIAKLLFSYETSFLRDENFYYKIREQFNIEINAIGNEQAARFLFLVHTNYNGMFRLNTQGFYNVPIGKRKPCLPSLSHLMEISKKLEGVLIEQMDYTQIIDLVKPNDFIYIDPPYPPLDWSNHSRQYTIDRFSKENHKELANFANSLHDNGCFVMISNSDIPLIRDLYCDWNILELSTTRSISCKKERKKINELIIKNY